MISTYIKKFPTTLSLLAILSLTAILTNTHVQALPDFLLQQTGFAPLDLIKLDIKRMASSLFVTTDPAVFMLAFAMIAISAGLAEAKTSSLRTALTFFGVHSLSLIGVSLIALPLHWLNIAEGTLIALSRDVGPSAGYFGVLGLALAYHKKPIETLISAALMLFLIGAFFTETGHNRAMEYSADLAHLIAFPLGWLSAKIKINNLRAV